MALPKYSELLAYGKEKVKELLAPLRANEMRKKAELEICQLDATIVEMEQKLQEYASEYPIRYDRLLDAIDELDLMARRKTKFEQITKELFPDTK